LIGLLLLHGLLLALLLHGLLLILLLGLLLHRLLLLLILLLRLSDGLLSVVIVIAAAHQGEAGDADARTGRGSQKCPPAELSTSHSLPIVPVAHSNTFLQSPSCAKWTGFAKVCLVGFVFATLVSGRRLTVRIRGEVGYNQNI
jgi:hypothetical protein